MSGRKAADLAKVKPGRPMAPGLYRARLPVDYQGMIPARVAAVLAANGLSAIELEEGSTPTSPLAAERLGVQVGQIAKSILVKSKDGRLFLIVCPGDLRLSNGKLKELLGVRTSMATHEETLAATGFRPGGVCPFGIDGIPIYDDRALARYGTVYPAAGTDGSGVALSYADLLRITGATECDAVEPAGGT